MIVSAVRAADSSCAKAARRCRDVPLCIFLAGQERCRAESKRESQSSKSNVSMVFFPFHCGSFGTLVDFVFQGQERRRLRHVFEETSFGGSFISMGLYP